MSNLIAPSALIMINPEISDDVISMMSRQLFIDQVLSAADFDAQFAADGYYKARAYFEGKKILVIRSFLDPTNRGEMDLVLFFANGNLSIEQTVFQSPPRATFPLESATLGQLLYYRPGYTTPGYSLYELSLLPCSPNVLRADVPYPMIESLLPRP